ncbi:hypothetical protein [Streptomyces resistomycificus]|uniref:hypothetical protein n=2 Tax=Streptomyces resistomycificus TaxID=67356 RepID=UPI0012FF4526|nr:hypothetical protein [Streptomyces resistomycificus]
MIALRDEEVATLAPIAVPAIEAVAARVSAQQAWAQWESDVARYGGAVPVWEGRWYYSVEASRLYELVNDSPLDALEAACELHVLDWWDRYDDAVEPFFAGARKDNPVAALFHAVGPQRARALPGWAGDALLTSAEVSRSLPAVERALDLAGAEREQVLARIEDWLADGEDPAALLDGLLRVWQQTEAAGLGLFSSRIWH